MKPRKHADENQYDLFRTKNIDFIDEHRMTRNFLKGIEGDNTNAILACCGFNMRKLLRAIARFLYFFDKFHVPTSIFFRSEFIV
jgi:hypothetical protein